MECPRNKAEVRPDPVLWAFLVVPLLLAAGKLPFLPTAALFTDVLSLTDLPPHFRGIVENALMVPLGALIVVIFRLTLGVRVLGLFRPILLAIGFNVVGIAIGAAFLAIVLAIIVVLRPLLRTDHSYARVAVLLSLVATLLLVPLIIGRYGDIGWLTTIAYFPVIALCLTCESFAKVMDQEGVGEAAWRALTTIIAALAILAVMRLMDTLGFFLRFPELLLVQAGCILLINKHLDLRLLEGWNPLRRRPQTTEDGSPAGTSARQAETTS